VALPVEKSRVALLDPRRALSYHVREVNKVPASASVRKKLNAQGLEIVGGTPEQFAEHIRKETAKWADVVKRAGVKVD
jgi:tripartite-type tricarboxylate transporter receptor subunit TctC